MKRSSDRLVVLIGLFKLAKAALLTTAGVLGLTTAGPERLALAVERTALWMGGLPGRETLHRTADKLWSLDGARAHRLAALALAYAAVFVVEGVGLVLKKHWAEWLTVAVTASFIPLEIYELAVHFGAGKLVALVLNVLIVIYLARVRLRDRPARRLTSAAPAPRTTAQSPWPRC